MTRTSRSTKARDDEAKSAEEEVKRPESDELDASLANEEQGNDEDRSVDQVDGESHDSGADAWESRANDQAVADQVKKALESLGITRESILASLHTEQVAPQEDLPQVEPPRFKYHFRCDSSPELKIQAMDMRAVDRGDRPQDFPIPNQWITFRLGHLQTNDENTARQIRWMMERPSVGELGQTIGGNQSIYEDDGSVLFRCPDCDFVTASSNGFKAHRRASHGV